MLKPVNSLIIFIILAMVVGTVIVAGIMTAENNKTSAPSVAATIFPIYDIAKNIAGDSIKVTLILPPGADAHSFEPSPSLLKELDDAKVIYAVGHHLDEWTEVLADGVGAEIITIDKGLELRLSAEMEEGPFDPHYWLSVPNAKTIAKTIADDLSERFPQNAEKFSKNLTSYLGELSFLDRETRENLKNIPNRNFVTFHDAWYYFADEYGLTVAGTFEPTAGREPTPQYLAELVSKIHEAEVKTIYYEPQMSITGYETFANDYDIELKVLDDIGGVAPYDSYINLIKTNVSTLQNNQ
jgi:ABC-type Zn uptake system ZnuABC Zn-binding protein ZnuA